MDRAVENENGRAANGEPSGEPSGGLVKQAAERTRPSTAYSRSRSPARIFFHPSYSGRLIDIMLFRIDPRQKNVTQIPASSFKALDIWERRDLQEWIAQEPALLGEELLVVSTEFTNFEQSKDRLDVLAVDRNGKLVVVELKRDQAAGYADLQALRYAAMVAPMGLEEVAEARAKYLARVKGHPSAPATEVNVIREFIEEVDEDFDFDERPRIILASENFSPEITTTVLWLRDQHKIDVSCVRITPHRVDEVWVLATEVVIPLREAADYQVRLREKEERKVETREHKRLTVKLLLERGLVKPGDKVYLRHDLPHYAQFRADDPTFIAEVSGDESLSRFLRWARDGELYSVSGLAWRILAEQHPAGEPGSINGNYHWENDQGVSFWELARESG